MTRLAAVTSTPGKAINRVRRSATWEAEPLVYIRQRNRLPFSSRRRNVIVWSDGVIGVLVTRMGVNGLRFSTSSSDTNRPRHAVEYPALAGQPLAPQRHHPGSRHQPLQRLAGQVVLRCPV